MTKKYELIANTILSLIGIIGGTIFFILDSKELCPIFFSIAFAAILYQFLGGIGDDNNFSLGAIKFGGSAAILIGFLFFLKTSIFTPNPEKCQVKYSSTEWIPIDPKTGETIQLNISYGDSVDHFPLATCEGKRKSQVLKVEDSQDGTYAVSTSNPKEQIGYFDLNNLQTSTLFNKMEIDGDETSIQVFTLYPDDKEADSTEDISSLSLPFQINVFNHSRFSILVNDEPITQFTNREVVPRTAYLLNIGHNQSYIIFLEQAASVITDSYDKRYSKWLVKRIRTSIATS